MRPEKSYDDLEASLEAELLKRGLLELEPQPPPALPLWEPKSDPQRNAISTLADELFYGGAAGGGKSDLALGIAITQHRRSLILRREATQVRGLEDRLLQIIGREGRYNSISGLCRLPGRIIELTGCKDEQDKRKFQGRPHDLIVFDEAPEFLESICTYIAAWLRSEVEGQRCRVIYTGNPPRKEEGRWIIRRFAPWLDKTFPTPAEPGELRWFAVIDGEEKWVDGPEPVTDSKGEVTTPRSRTFIPARLEDNPFYANTGYRSTLQGLPEPLRSQLLYGDFEAGEEEDAWAIIQKAWVRAAFLRYAEAKAAGQEALDKLKTAPLSVGADVACGGADAMVLARRWGLLCAPQERHPGAKVDDGPKAAALVRVALASGGRAAIDRTGIGQSCYDFCKGPQVDGVNFAEETNQKDSSGELGFKNVRALIWWRLREALDPAKGGALAIPEDPRVLGDLCAPRWSLTPQGILLESKDDIKKRIGRSTDDGDALALTFYEPEGAGLLQYYRDQLAKAKGQVNA